MTKVLIHHSEIGLKKGNLSYFEKKLAQNIKKTSERNNLNLLNVLRDEKRIVCEFKSNQEKLAQVLKKIPGIKNFSFAEEIKKDINSVLKKAEEIIKSFKKQGIKEISFETKRSDKNFSPNSVEINTKLGEIAKNLGLKINYKNPEKTIFTEITFKRIYIYTGKIPGIAGLPVGTGGRVLCLLSGGIDSPVSAFLMMKRGCVVDFLHFHAFRKNSEAYKSKIKNLAEQLNDFENKSKLFLIPYTAYEISSQGNIMEKYDLVLFKHYMLKLAEKLCREMKYDAIVTGDNLGQVASQTIENLKVSGSGINALILRPLLSYEKQEIIDLAKQIGTYKISIEKYKDCCSIISKKPSTKTKPGKFRKILGEFDMDSLVNKTFNEIERFDLK